MPEAFINAAVKSSVSLRKKRNLSFSGGPVWDSQEESESRGQIKHVEMATFQDIFSGGLVECLIMKRSRVSVYNPTIILHT